MIRTISQKIGKEHTHLLWWFWSWVLPSVILLTVGYKIWSSPGQLTMLNNLEVVHWSGLLFCLALLPLNLYLESYKWKVILDPVEKKRILDCVKIILSGRSLNVITPFGIGNVFARYISTTNSRRTDAVGGMLLDTLSGLVPTVLGGVISLLYLVDVGLDFPARLSPGHIVSIIFMTIMAFAFLVYRSRVKLSAYLALIIKLTLGSAIAIVGISVLRYVVFTIQFYCLFIWLGSELPNDVIFLGIAWIFLIKTILPGLSVLGDLVKRELSAMLFFSFFTDDLSIVLIASFVIWLINITLPALMGVSFIKDYKKAL